VRFVFLDEAGTSADEPITVVVGIIAHADKQLLFTEAAIEEVLGAVPKQFKDDPFSAKKVWNDERYKSEWGQTDRLDLLKNLMRLPRRIGMPVIMGVVRRSLQTDVPEKLTLAQWHHVWAFGQCITRADKYIRDNAGLDEVAMVVAEDIPEMRRFLRLAPKLLKEAPAIVPQSGLVPTQRDRDAGYITQTTDTRVSRLRDIIHFVEKGEEALLYLADACAFGIRRHLSNLQFGDELATAIFGKGAAPDRTDFVGVSSIAFIPGSADRFEASHDEGPVRPISHLPDR
jgi:hypothetical protein